LRNDEDFVLIWGFGVKEFESMRVLGIEIFRAKRYSFKKSE